jgi:hypothetical protein
MASGGRWGYNLDLQSLRPCVTPETPFRFHKTTLPYNPEDGYNSSHGKMIEEWRIVIGSKVLLWHMHGRKKYNQGKPEITSFAAEAYWMPPSMYRALLLRKHAWCSVAWILGLRSMFCAKLVSTCMEQKHVTLVFHYNHTSPCPLLYYCMYCGGTNSMVNWQAYLKTLGQTGLTYDCALYQVRWGSEQERVCKTLVPP